MTVNAYQVGGNHYKHTSYEHWDAVLNLGLGYLEGQATRYVARWRKKNGAEDLRKALHYVNKLDENRARAFEIVCRVHHDVVAEEIARFAAANGLTPLERRFFEHLATWTTADDLSAAREVLFQLLDEAEEAPAPVPLTDSNKHADRAGVPHGRASQD